MIDHLFDENWPKLFLIVLMALGLFSIGYLIVDQTGSLHIVENVEVIQTGTAKLGSSTRRSRYRQTIMGAR